MSRRCNSRGSARVRDEDVERQGSKDDGIGSEQKKIIKLATGLVNHPLMMKIISKTPWWLRFQYFHWDVAFLVVCVVAVAVDPLFFYLPVINEATKCITIDNKLKIIAICVRSFLDLVAFGNLVASRVYMMSSDHVIFNILAILPVPQVLGAFWYFFSIERETTCWHVACEPHQTDIGCSETSFNCHAGFGNHTILNDYCSLEKTTNTTLSFDFGIFQEARQSGILASMDFPRKAMFCFWWGLRNLSSLGQNLQTSPDYWENCFTVLISIFGLLLFLYFIGNLQVYMQWEASNELNEITSKWSKIIQTNKLRSIEVWISTIGLPDELKHEIMSHVRPILEDQKKHIDTENPFLHLPTPLGTLIKLHLCLPLLRTVPIFENESEELLSEITSKYLTQVQYNQNSFIVREGKPLNAMIFLVKEIVCTCTSNRGGKTECLEIKCDLNKEHGQLVEWVLQSPRQPNPPLSTRTLKSHTKVEAFCLMTGDLKDIMSQYWWKFIKFRNITQFDSEQLKHFAASSIQAAWRCYHAIHPKQERT